jgi:protease-4
LQPTNQYQPPQPVPQPPRRSNRGCIWAAAILGGLGLLTLIALVVAVVAIAGNSDRSSGPITWDEQFVSGSGPNKIAVLPVVGVIGQEGGGVLSAQGATPETLRSQLMQAAGDDNVRAIVLEVNSPGGGVVASDEMYRDILDFKSETKKPVVVSMGDTAASGGYYISMASDRVVANPATLTGSLGVILSYLNYEEAAKKLGLKQVVIKSGPYKDIGSPTRELTGEERRILQDLIDDAYNQFVDVIDKGRPGLSREQVLELANGRIYSGKDAKEVGLVDSLGDLDDAAGEARKLANLDAARVVRYEHNPGLLSLLTSRSQPQEPEALAVLKAAGFDPAPRLEYVYRP